MTDHRGFLFRVLTRPRGTRFGIGVTVLVLITSVQISSATAQGERDDEIIRLHDIVTYSNRIGEEITVTGRVTNESSAGLTFEQLNSEGKVNVVFPLEKNQIVKILRSNSPEQVYRRKRKRLPRLPASARERAGAQLALGLWCRRPSPALSGEEPAEEKSYGHLLAAIRLDAELIAAYPHLLDILEERRAAGSEVGIDEELEIYLQAADGGFEHPEIQIRMSEIFAGLGWSDRAEEMLTRILVSEGKGNQSVQNRARSQLAEIYLERGEVGLASELFQVVAAASEESADGAFDGVYLTAKMLLVSSQAKDRARVRALLEKASELQPNYYGTHMQLAALDLLEGKAKEAGIRLKTNYSLGKGDPEYVLARAVVYMEQGHFSSAARGFGMATELLSKVDDPEILARAPVIQGQIHVARGLLADYTGKRDTAVTEYRKAWDNAPDGALLSVRTIAGILLARSLRRSDDVRGARNVLDEIARTHASDPGIFAAYARSLADVALESQDLAEAERLLQHAVSHEPSDARLLVKFSTVLLHRGEIDRAFPYLERARELEPALPEVYCGLGNYYYSRGDMAESERAFRRVLDIVQKDPLEGERAGELARCRVYADRGLMLVEDARTLEFWEDNFDREDGPQVLRGWNVVDHYGILVSVRDQQVVVAGRQTNSADGVTKLFRESQTGDVERLAVRIRFPRDAQGRFRAGIRMETQESEGNGLVFVRDFDGRMRVSLRDKKGDWRDLTPAEEDPAKGRTSYSDSVVYPDDGGFHTLMISRAGARSGGKGFDCLLDGVPVAFNVRVPQFMTKKSRPVLVGVSGQAADEGVEYSFQVDDFRIYRRKEKEVRRASR